jgi:hypothetical protein
MPPAPPTVADYLAPYLSGRSAFDALKVAVDDIASTAPQDHDVVIIAHDIFVSQVGFREPHTLIFKGVTKDGHRTGIVCHFSQLLVRVVYIPKRGPNRIITGFSQTDT